MMFFENWQGLGRVLLGCALAYPFLILLLRISGKRVLAQMNIFDFIVTVALGSTLSSVIVSKEVPLLEGLLALSGLVGLQVLVTRLSNRSSRVEALVKSQPVRLAKDGEFQEDAMRAERVSHSEIFQAIRSHGLLSLNEVEAVVLETNGSFNVIKRSEKSPADGEHSLSNVS